MATSYRKEMRRRIHDRIYRPSGLPDGKLFRYFRDNGTPGKSRKLINETLTFLTKKHGKEHTLTELIQHAPPATLSLLLCVTMKWEGRKPSIADTEDNLANRIVEKLLCVHDAERGSTRNVR